MIQGEATNRYMLDSKGFDLWADGYDKTVQISEYRDEYPFAAYKEVLNTVYNKVKCKKGTLLDIGILYCCGETEKESPRM